MKEETKLAIEGYNQEKIKIQEHLLSLPVGRTDFDLLFRLREIDDVIERIIQTN